MSLASLCLLTLLVHAPSAEAGGLRASALPARMNPTDVEGLLLSQFSNAFRDGDAREHISSLETELTVMYKVVPKDASGGLGHASVRYMLHRFFLQRYGWSIRGLEPGNASTLQSLAGGDESELRGSVQEWVPGYLQQFVEEIQGGRGINLRELAVLAATLEDLLRKESNHRLEMTFNALELTVSTPLNEDQVWKALEVYMMIYLMGGSFEYKDRKEVLYSHKIFSEDQGYGWEDVQKWMHSIQAEVVPNSIEKTLDFPSASRVVEEIGRRYGNYNYAGQCQDVKSAMLQIESTKAGRVRLAEFYKKGLSSDFDFTQKIEYLRALGTIDDSNASEPYLIIPNYIASRPNCLMVSDFYSTCCRSECEDLLATVEKKFGKPTASLEEVLALVVSLSTKTVEAPRTLSDALVRRLDSIATANEGQIPLHGRLFAQWMHHAFPRECPYPQQSGDMAPMTADEWMHVTGHESTEQTNEEMQVIVEGASFILPVGHKARQQHDFPENELPWDQSEELLYPAKDSATDVVIFRAASPKARQHSLFDKVAPVFSILSAAALLAWKMTRNKKGSGWHDGLVV